MLYLHSSDDISLLADDLSSILDNSPSDNPLTPDLFVVQNHGMAQWLSLRFAEKQGIAANMEFKFPAEVFWHIIRLLKPNVDENLPSDRRPMTWAIFRILQKDTDPALHVLHQYVSDDEPGKQEMRCWQLACRIGDVFDQYLTYRADMLIEWENEATDLRYDNNTEQWQAALWRKLSRNWRLSHPAKLQKNVIRQISKRDIRTGDLPVRLSVFGVSEMPPVYLKMFVKLSKHIDVHFYLMDIVKNHEHPLVESLGQSGREIWECITEEQKSDRGLTVKTVDGGRLSSQSSSETLFKTFKADLQDYEIRDRFLDYDNSIQIHSCHSTRREVEVLYDQLLEIFDTNTHISPSDVLVLSPQIEDYAPDIRAVFGVPEQGAPEIPFHLLPSSAERSVDISLKKLLQLIDSRFKVTDVLELLDFGPIRETFLFSEEDIQTLERWIGDNRIRWGINEQHKQSLKVPSTRSFTWQAGLHRMMAGYAMAQTNDQLFEAIYPYDEIEQAAHADLLGRFSGFMHQLYRCHHQIGQGRSPAQWSDLLNDWLEQFYTDADETARQLQALRKILAELKEETAMGGLDTTIGFQIIRNYLKNRLDRQSTGGGRRGRGVTFSSMVAMRNIPAKVVCLIGLNDGVFPTPSTAVGFDLMTMHPKPGDRIQAKIDRQLFLESIMAAEECFYVSYTGQSNKKEVDFPPSVAVREITNYLINNYGINENSLVQHHRLHAFSTKYFEEKDNVFFSYSTANKAVAEGLQSSVLSSQSFFDDGLPKADNALKKISINDLVDFFQHPLKFVINQRLGIYLNDEEVLDDDRESFELDGLQKYQLKQEILGRNLNNQSIEKYRDVANARDRLPEGWPGEQLFKQTAIDVQEFSKELQQYLNQPQLEPIEVRYSSGDFLVKGQLAQVFKNHQLLYRFGSLRAKDRLELWIKHLLFQVVKPGDHPGRSIFAASAKNKNMEVCRLSPVPEPQKIIDKLLTLYWQGMADGLLFFPKSSFAYAEAAIKKGKNDKKALEAARKEWDDEWNDFNEKEKGYNKLYIGDYNLLDDNKLKNRFIKLSETVWAPFFSAIHSNNGGDA